ncbi:MAG: EamA/RhaT family transporter [Flavobacteriales bacterium]|nr:EamA/RhaT family transporter [Flavobacteriales bacterium]
MYLLLSILFSSIINVVFKLFPKYGIDNRQAISVNYLTCVAVGLLTSNSIDFISAGLFQESWVQIALALGILFIVVFVGMAVTAQKMGISVSVIAAKMGVVFPVLYAFFFLHEAANTMLVLGILLSLLSIYFVTQKEHLHLEKKHLLMPILVLLGSGVIDTTLKIIEQKIPDNYPMALPSIIIFSMAGLVGTTISTFQYLGKKSAFAFKNVLAGIVLGIPNYFSIYFLFRSLQNNFFKTTQIYPLNNIGVVLLSTLLALVFFREKLSIKNWLGIAFAVISILLIGGLI